MRKALVINKCRHNSVVPTNVALHSGHEWQGPQLSTRPWDVQRTRHPEYSLPAQRGEGCLEPVEVAFRPASSLDLLLFFRAVDGIRNPLVTGVQTCALPI